MLRGCRSIPCELPWVQPPAWQGQHHPKTSSAPGHGHLEDLLFVSPGYPGTSLLCQQPSPDRKGTSSISCQSSAIDALPKPHKSPKKKLKIQIASRTQHFHHHHTKPLSGRDGLSPRPLFPSSSSRVRPITAAHRCISLYEELTCSSCPSFSQLQMWQKGAAIAEERQIKGEATPGRWPSDRMFRAKRPAGRFKVVLSQPVFTTWDTSCLLLKKKVSWSLPQKSGRAANSCSYGNKVYSVIMLGFFGEGAKKRQGYSIA